MSDNGWIRRLPSGLWAATVHTPAGRITETHELKDVVRDWAREQISQIARGDWIDPRKAKTTIGEVWDRYGDTRRLEKASRKRDQSHWKCHVEPRWRPVPVGAVLKPDVRAWVVDMERRGVGAATIEGSHGVLLAILDIAIDAGYVRHNSARRVGLPKRDAHLDRVLGPEEDELLLDALDRHAPDLPCGRLFCELLLYCGLRWEEAAAIDREHVDLRMRLINVGPVVERDGTIRGYPKSPAGERPVPVDDDLWPRVRARAMAVKPGGLLITAVEGGVLHYSTWHDRVWQPAIHGVTRLATRVEWSPATLCAFLDERMTACGFATDKDLAQAAGVNPSMLSNWRSGRFRPRPKRLEPVATVLDVPVDEMCRRVGLTIGVPGARLDDPQPTPHDLRHTYGTRLGEQGVPPHEIKALMGHENLESVDRYLHAGADRFERARKAMRRARSS